MQNNNKKALIITALIGAVPVSYIGALFAVATEETKNIFEAISWIQNNPTDLHFCESTAKVVLIFLLIYGFAMLYIASNKKNYRRGKEHGDAKFGDVAQVNNQYRYKKDQFQNKILTQNVQIGLDGFIHQRNLNTLVVGGAGTSKTKGLVQPNILQGNTSFVILDPKGENLEDNGNFLKAMGYDIKVLNLKDMTHSDCYNPFRYAENDDDITKIATILLKSTTPKGTNSQDPYWDQQAEILLKALMYYLFHEAVEEEQNFPTLVEILREAKVIEGKEEEESVVDELFNRLERKNPDHIALKYYRDYRGVPGKTLNTIQSVLKGKLEKFNSDSLKKIMSTDDLDLTSLGQRKTALFCVIPDDDTSFNFVISILYLQLFQQLERYADSLPGKRLPIHVQFLMDEFSNVALPDDFEKTISVARSRGFSFTIILQNMAQIKAKFEKEWESIVGNCDSFVYLGGNEQSTHKYVSELLGKETIDTNTYGKTSGRNGSYTTNYQTAGRDLMTPDEVRMLDNSYALLFIRGSRPIIDKKHNVWKHPNAKYTTLGAKNKTLKSFAKKHPKIKCLSKWRGGEPYVYGSNVTVEYPIEVYLPDEEIEQDTILDIEQISADIDKVIQAVKDRNYL